MTEASYDPTRVTFSLNSIANAPSNRKGSVEELQDYAKKLISAVLTDGRIQELIGQWELVWGPVVYQEKGSRVADNAMYVARNKTTPTEYVVAISGTNPISKYGWIHEDFLINPMQDWPYTEKQDPESRISNGTNTGLDILISTMEDSSEKKLTDYLGKQVSAAAPKPLSVWVTGHSLGGALSPALALALKDLQGKDPGWDPQAGAAILVEPSAGPTPGDGNWATYYGDEIGKATTRLWNQIDIVPHAWQLNMLDEIPTLYEPFIPKSKFISAAVELAKINSEIAGDMKQIRPDVQGLPGKVDPDIIYSLAEIVELLEALAANDLIDRIGKILKLKDWEITAVKKIVDTLIKHHKSLPETVKSVTLKELEAQHLKFTTNIQDSLKEDFSNFLKFLYQAVHQHTSAYAGLVGTTEFADRVKEIKKTMGSRKN